MNVNVFPDVHTEAVQAALAKHKERKMAVPMPSKRRSLVVQTSMDAYTPPGMGWWWTVNFIFFCTSWILHKIHAFLHCHGYKRGTLQAHTHTYVHTVFHVFAIKCTINLHRAVTETLCPFCESPEGAVKTVTHTHVHTAVCLPARFIQGQPSGVLPNSTSCRAEKTSADGLCFHDPSSKIFQPCTELIPISFLALFFSACVSVFLSQHLPVAWLVGSMSLLST